MKAEEHTEDDDILERVDLEKHAKESGKGAPPARRYTFRVDKDHITVEGPTITGREILGLVNKTPEGHKLYQHVRGKQPIPVEAARVIDLREPGLERFTTMPRDTTEGCSVSPCLHQDFRLPESDESYLNGIGLSWEARRDGDNLWVIIHEWSLPEGYSHRATSLALLIPPNYSDNQIDMVYFKDQISRKDGTTIGGLSFQPIGTSNWQRWSRHRTGENPWRPGVDDISSHLSLVDEWLRREFEKAA